MPSVCRRGDRSRRVQGPQRFRAGNEYPATSAIGSISTDPPIRKMTRANRVILRAEIERSFHRSANLGGVAGSRLEESNP